MLLGFAGFNHEDTKTLRLLGSVGGVKPRKATSLRYLRSLLFNFPVFFRAFRVFRGLLSSYGSFQDDDCNTW